MRGLPGFVAFCLFVIPAGLTCHAQSSAPDQSAPPPAPPAMQEQVPASESQDDLPWQPGLGQPVQLPPQTPAALPQGQPANGGIPQPQPATPIPVARPLPGGTVGNAVAPQPGSIPGQAPPPGQGIPYPVQPTTLVTQPQDAAGNPNVVDSNITQVTRGMQQLPNDAGQVWRTYDISPYTYMIQNTNNPQQAVVDWILKETGTELWFSQPMGVLNAARNELHVYHTPEVQDRIKPIIDRFVNSRGQARVVGLKLATIASPDWRSSAFSMMQPVEVHSPGLEAWLMSKENAAILAGILRNRGDYQERSNSDLIVNDGQKYLLGRTQPVNFIRSLGWVNDGVGQYRPINDQIDEGYTLEFSTLSSIDGQSIEAIIGCQLNQIERVQPVTIELPGPAGNVQPVQLQIPQLVSWEFDERFRWPADQVLVLSAGVVATPDPQRQALLGIPALLSGTRHRADALMFIEYKGVAQAAPQPTPAQGTAANSNGLLPVTPRR
ncbi:MAG: hypothetical protein ACR2NP_17325 [Pirellulaceae bacterium]